jgi:hypothetical protein
MSQYERRRRSNVLSGDGSRLPNGGNTRVGQRGSGHLAAFSVCLGGRLDKTGTHANDGSRGEAVGKPGVARVYTNQRLNLSKPWEDLRMTSQGFKPGSGNPTVRHYRGALGNVRHGETETPSCNRKSGNGNPSPTAGRAQFLSQPSASCEARSAPRSYPTGGRATASGDPVLRVKFPGPTRQTLPSSLRAARPLPPSADIGPGGQSVGQAAQFCLVPFRMRLGMRCRLSPTADVPSYTSGAAMCPTGDSRSAQLPALFNHLVGAQQE